ncbi:MAG: helix-turn-helix domain-containing protein [Halobacteriales archaeon]|nr:helix-turn-helix domain-containing protein [Halobacteriales archaeon]
MASIDVLRVLGNEYNPEILEAAYEPRSAQDLSEALDVPIATCYRRIEELTEADLLELHDRPLSDQHRRVNVYRRRVDEVNVRFEDDVCRVDVAERSEVKNKLDDVWRSLSQR